MKDTPEDDQLALGTNIVLMSVIECLIVNEIVSPLDLMGRLKSWRNVMIQGEDVGGKADVLTGSTMDYIRTMAKNRGMLGDDDGRTD